MLTKGPYMVLPVVMYGCESWAIKKAEHRRIDAFELWCWRRLLRVPWTARRSNQSTLKEISPGISLEGMMLKLKLQYFGHLMQRVDSLEKTLMLGAIGGKRRRGRQRMRWLDGIRLDGRDSEWTPGVGDGQGGLACCDSWGCKGSDTTEWLNWTELTDGASIIKNLTANAGDVGLIPISRRSPGEGSGTHSSILAWETPWTEEPGGLKETGWIILIKKKNRWNYSLLGKQK